MTTEKVLITSNLKYANLSVVIGAGRDTLNISVDTFEDLSKIPLSLAVSIPKDENDQEYQRNILKVNFNLCRLFNGVTGDFVSKMISSQLKKISNIPLKCPMTKNQYAFNNFHLNDEFFPSYLLNNIKSLTEVKAMGKVGNQKNLVLLFVMRVYGSLEKN